MNTTNIPRTITRICAIAYAIILITLNFIRIFDNNFWGDEAFTINLIHGTIPQIIAGTAADVHPPLYYLIVKLVYTILGGHGWVYHLASFIPYALLMLLSYRLIWRHWGVRRGPSLSPSPASRIWPSSITSRCACIPGARSLSSSATIRSTVLSRRMRQDPM